MSNDDYELYDFDGNRTYFENLENKGFWCALSENNEIAFVKIFDDLKGKGYITSELTIDIHPAKDEDKYHPDLIVNDSVVGEAKIKNSPLFKARTYKVKPQYAPTMDLKDVFKYQKSSLKTSLTS